MSGTWDSDPDLWRPDLLPGKKGFDVAHELRASDVQARVEDFMTTDLAALGTFDVVLYLGVLYHMRHPLLGLERLATVTKELAVIETQALVVPGLEDLPWCQFFERDELNGDPSNWWVPNRRGVEAMCRAAGFDDVETVVGPPDGLPRDHPGPHHYRGVFNARKRPPAG